MEWVWSRQRVGCGWWVWSRRCPIVSFVPLVPSVSVVLIGSVVPFLRGGTVGTGGLVLQEAIEGRDAIDIIEAIDTINTIDTIGVIGGIEGWIEGVELWADCQEVMRKV